MSDRIIEILTSHKTPETVCVMGNEAVGRAALEAGVQAVFAYPGTPSTDISELCSAVSNYPQHLVDRDEFPDFVPYPLQFEYSINEKIALEKAIAVSLGHKKVMCCMKNVGMNVASDALMSITYQEISGALVVIVCDDPGCHSSSNEQDSRHWGPMASVPIFCPASAADAYKMTMEAFDLSSELQLPVLVRLTTRISHTRGTLQYNSLQANITRGKFERKPIHINIPARNAEVHDLLLEKLKSPGITTFFDRHNVLTNSGEGTEYGVIVSGVAAIYLDEIIQTHHLEKELSVFKIGLTYPVPEKGLLEFCQRGFNKILILEEADPFVENQVRILLQKNKIYSDVLGKGFSTLKPTGEFSVTSVQTALADFMERTFEQFNTPLTNTDDFLNNLPIRPPTLCDGCPHRATYYALRLLVSRGDEGPIICGDIGCMGLGALAPLRMLDTVNHMGMSIPMAQGLSQAVKEDSPNGAIAIIGDGTFFHSGIPALLNAVYTRSNITLIIFDNRTIAMTGGQNHPGGIENSTFQRVDLETMIKGLSVASITTVDPFELKNTYAKIKTAIETKGVSVVIAKSPCIKLESAYNIQLNKRKVVVDPNRCTTCFHHEDTDLSCSQVCDNSSNMARGRAKMTATTHIPAKDQSCPANICNHGFFNAVLAENHQAAVDIIRDSMLFARTCGDICHKPCESGGENVVPIKALKHFTSSFSETFLNFSKAEERYAKSTKKTDSIAVVGAGPAGLSAAYDLSLQGYPVTIFEKESEAGGLLKFVIPDFRMQKEGYDEEINFLKRLGVKFRMNTAMGVDVKLEQLAEDYAAVVMATGLAKSLSLELIDQNVQPTARFSAIDFLRKYHDGVLNLEKNSIILVIGGGNSAMDVARTAKHINPDLQVIVTCIEDRDNMPAFSSEIVEAEEAGVEILDNSFVKTCESGDSNIVNIDLHSFDSKIFLKSVQVYIVVTAIGTSADPSMFSSGSTIQFDDTGRLECSQNSEVSAATNKNIFVAGDLSAGNHMSLIGAIAGGKKAAVGVRKLLEGYNFDYEAEQAFNALNEKPRSKGNKEWKLDKDKLLSQMQQYDLHQPCAKCSHCIDNFGCPSLVRIDGKIVIHDPSCTGCGLCIDVCPNNAIIWADELQS
ncbi:MAG: FAD-dependent oxidoreductase [Proteobacteria bacterium]|nr:FAD-dependent oxidoreductase [Pseudomonadota bacterium]